MELWSVVAVTSGLGPLTSVLPLPWRGLARLITPLLARSSPSCCPCSGEGVRQGLNTRRLELLGNVRSAPQKGEMIKKNTSLQLVGLH